MKQLTRRLSQQATFTASPSILAVDKQEIYLQKLEMATFNYLDLTCILGYCLISTFVLELPQSQCLKGCIYLLLFIICLPGLFLTFPGQFSFGEGSLIFQCLLLSISSYSNLMTLISTSSVIALTPRLLKFKTLPNLDHLLIIPILSFWVQMTMPSLTLDLLMAWQQFVVENGKMLVIWSLGMIVYMMLPK